MVRMANKGISRGSTDRSVGSILFGIFATGIRWTLTLWALAVIGEALFAPGPRRRRVTGPATETAC